MYRFIITGETPAKKNSRIVLKGGRNIPSERYRKWHSRPYSGNISGTKRTAQTCLERTQSPISFIATFPSVPTVETSISPNLDIVSFSKFSQYFSHFSRASFMQDAPTM